MRRLAEDWERIACRLRDAHRIALFLDFDGTLAAVADAPERTSINLSARGALRRLAANSRVDAWIISGRRRANLCDMVGVRGIGYLGVQGADVAGVAFSEALVARVAKARRGLAAQLNGTQGVILEDKTLALTVHYRKARWPDEIRARAVVHQFVDQFDGALKCVEGDCALEILPREIPNKGDVVRKIWRSRAPQALPVFAGNDATDEPAFVALASGITIRTGAARHTRAQYWVRDAGEVGWFLGRLEEELRKRRHPVSNS